MRVLVVDDEPLIRAGIMAILASERASKAGISVVGEVSDGVDVVPAIQAHMVDVVLLDIRMRTMDGISATAAARALPHPPQVVIMTAFDADDYVVRAIQAGASGFLLKDESPEGIIRAIEAVAAGDSMFSTRSARSLVRHVARSNSAEQQYQAIQLLSVLAPREREVVIAATRGLKNEEIAEAMHISVATVKSQLNRVTSRLDLNRVQLAVQVCLAGWLQDG